MRYFLLILFTLCLQNFFFGQTPGKDRIYLNKTDRTRTTTYSNGRQSNTRSIFYDFKLGNDGYYQRLDRKAKNLYAIVKVFPEAAQKIDLYNRCRKKNNAMNGLKVLSYLAVGAGAALFVMQMETNPPLAYSGIGIGVCGITGAIVIQLKQKKTIDAAQMAIEDCVSIYNSKIK